MQNFIARFLNFIIRFFRRPKASPNIKFGAGTHIAYLDYKVRRYDNRTEWWLDGCLHRVSKPAIRYNSGSSEWWFNGQRHRVGGPAVVYSDYLTGKIVKRRWYKNGLLHSAIGAAIDSLEKRDGNHWQLK